MHYYKTIESGLIVSAEKRESKTNAIEITEQEYNDILEAIKGKPTSPNGKDYRLTDALTWELVDLPPEPAEKSTEEQLAEANEALRILGVST